MKLKKCGYCGNDVPTNGQCNKCGFIDGMHRQPTDAEFRAARSINTKFKYTQFENIDMLLLD